MTATLRGLISLDFFLGKHFAAFRRGMRVRNLKNLQAGHVFRTLQPPSVMSRHDTVPKQFSLQAVTRPPP